MPVHPIPNKTAAGQQELAKRVLGLSQRHRTVLLLVDGRRPLAQVLSLGQAAGVQRAVFDDLVDRGLVQLPAAEVASPPRPASVARRPGPVADAHAQAHTDINATQAAVRPGAGDAAGKPAAPVVVAPAPEVERVRARLRETTPWHDTDLDLSLDPSGDSTLLPAARSLLPESAWNPLDALPPGNGLERPIEEARELMIRAVRREAPVSGAITVVKLKMANSREDLVGLLDEVELRLNKPRRQIISAQTMRHVRHLLTMAESMASVPGA